MINIGVDPDYPVAYLYAESSRTTLRLSLPELQWLTSIDGISQLLKAREILNNRTKSPADRQLDSASVRLQRAKDLLDGACPDTERNPQRDK